MKKALGETQTLHTGCSKAEPKIFATLQTPFPGAQDGQNLISWRRSLPSPTDPVWWRLMHAISSYRGNRPTNTRCPPARLPVANPQTGLTTIHCAAKLSAQCNNYTLAISLLQTKVWMDAFAFQTCIRFLPSMPQHCCWTSGRTPGTPPLGWRYVLSKKRTAPGTYKIRSF